MIYEIKGEKYDVITSENERWVNGSVYHVMYLEGDIPYYYLKDSSNPTLDKKEARILFDFSFTWRGVWESRIYFKDDEYWGSELEEIYMLWSKIEINLKYYYIDKYPKIKILENE